MQHVQHIRTEQIQIHQISRLPSYFPTGMFSVRLTISMD